MHQQQVSWQKLFSGKRLRPLVFCVIGALFILCITAVLLYLVISQFNSLDLTLGFQLHRKATIDLTKAETASDGTTSYLKLSEDQKEMQKVLLLRPFTKAMFWNGVKRVMYLSSFISGSCCRFTGKWDADSLPIVYQMENDADFLRPLVLEAQAELKKPFLFLSNTTVEPGVNRVARDGINKLSFADVTFAGISQVDCLAAVSLWYKCPTGAELHLCAEQLQIVEWDAIINSRQHLLVDIHKFLFHRAEKTQPRAEPYATPYDLESVVLHVLLNAMGMENMGYDCQAGTMWQYLMPETEKRYVDSITENCLGRLYT